MANNRCKMCGKYLNWNQTLDENGFCLACHNVYVSPRIEAESSSSCNSDTATSTNPNSSTYLNDISGIHLYLEQSNTIGNAVKIIGIILIFISFILGLIIGSQTGDYNWATAFMIMIGGSFYGLLIMAIGEIVLLLQGGNNKLKVLIKLIESSIPHSS